LRVTRQDEARAETPPDAEAVRQAAGRLNEALRALDRDLAISIHEESGRMIVEVTDPTTGEVVRQIPPERVVEVEESIDKIVGLFVNDTA
jgi:flagellar protein FlaG